MFKGVTVAYQGIDGAYSHLACFNYFGKSIKCIGNETFEDAMEMVERGDADYALIPIENKTAGRVDEFYGLIPQLKLQIVGEHFQKIEHCLMGVENSSIDDIEFVYSHPQGLAQCREHIKQLRIKPIARFDTAGSAKEISRLNNKKVAAVASSLAAKTYGLKILKYNMHDQKDNFTRFLALANRKEFSFKPNSRYITSIMFEVKNIPSALYKAIGGFAKNSVNILKIESYIPLGKIEESHFHIDVDGSIESKELKLALKELKLHTLKIKILGSYERNLIR